MALGRLRYDGTRATYRGRRVHPTRGEVSVTLDPLEMLARRCQHLPPPGLHLTRRSGTSSRIGRGP
ncbi:MAG: transposase, partial [Gemmatimonadales bacterium]